MKILFQAYNLCMQNEAGGVATKIQALYKHLCSMDVNVTYYFPFRDKIKEFDVLHIFKANIENFSLIEYAKKNGVKVVISSIVPCIDRLKIQGNLALCGLLPITTGIKIIHNSFLYADSIITETEQEKHFIQKYYSIQEKKIVSMPNGIDEEFIGNEADDSIFKLINCKKYVLCVGRFDENKNQLRLIKALRLSKIPIVFIGGPTPETENYYKECKRNASSNMFFLGWINHSDPLLRSAYQNAHVLITPSIYEAFGISIIEGAAFGANIALSNTLPISKSELFERYRFNPKDINSIKACIELAYNEKKDENLSRRVKDTFLWRNIARQQYDLYYSLLKKG